MDPEAILDYALFQLTPTRTRCDLVVFCGGRNEKLASGLAEPFISHLKFAKDEITKGGYSISLRPPRSTDATWFTKATIQRFVRFVSTPEILERFVRLEQEILQIEDSVQSNAFTNVDTEEQAPIDNFPAVDGITRKSSDSSKLKYEVERADGDAPEEIPKFRLQRLLDTRKAILRKEQAMAYARAIVAGFEIDRIDDLLCFAEAFGASRLRKACLDFKELYRQKHTDGQWMDALAAMRQFSAQELSYVGNSGIILANENNSDLNSHGNGTSTSSLPENGSSDFSSNASPPNTGVGRENSSPDPKVQVQMPWPNQIPQYMYNFQNPHQQIPFSGMHPLAPQYPQMFWPQSMNGGFHMNQRSSKKKEKSSTVRASESSEEDEEADSSESDSDGAMDQEKKHSRKEKEHNKKHKKKSSKTVVIRNVNFITSNKKNGQKDGGPDDSSVEAESLEDSIKHEVEYVVSSLEKHHSLKTHNGKNGSNGYSDDPAAKISEGGERNENWAAFQNLLMNQEESEFNKIETKHMTDLEDEHFVVMKSDGVSSTRCHAMDLESEKVKKQYSSADDSILVLGRDGIDGDKGNSAEFSFGEDTRTGTKRINSEEIQLFSQNYEETPGNTLERSYNFIADSSSTGKGRKEDWFVVNQGNREIQNAKQTVLENNDALRFEGERFQSETSKRTAPVDDSFFVESRRVVDDTYDSQWKTDISIVADWSTERQPENGQPKVSNDKPGICGTNEPEDLFVVLSRDSAIESRRASWNTEMDYGMEISFTESGKKSSAVKENGHVQEEFPSNEKNGSGKKAASAESKNSGKGTKSKTMQGPLLRNKPEVKGKKTPPTNRLINQRSKFENEEDVRKRMEELAIERAKRIAERTASIGGTSVSSKKVPAGGKVASPKIDKYRPQYTTKDPKGLSSKRSSIGAVGIASA